MTVESVTYISDLNASYPAGTDSKAEGDNHIRNLKTGIKTTFPNISGAVTSTHTELNLLDGVTATTAELNYVDVATAGAAEASKALVLDGSKGITGITTLGATTATFTTGTLTTANITTLNLGGSAVTSTAAELNILDGVTSTTAELNILDGVTATAAELNYCDVTAAGTAQASKAVILDGSKNITGLGTISSGAITSSGTITGPTINASTTLQIGGVSVTSTAAELNILDGVTATAAELNYCDVTTAGTAQASKAVILDGSKNITGLGTISSGSITTSGTVTGSTVNASTTLQIGGVSVTSTAAEINKLDGYTGNVNDLNILSGGAAAGVTATEFQYLNGVTSAIQTQLDALGTSTVIGPTGDHAVIDTTVLTVSGLTAATDYTIGPTGSGADVIWTPLDSVSGTPDYVTVKCYAEAQSTSGIVYVYAGNGDATSIEFIYDTIAKVATDGTINHTSISTVQIPVNSNKVFKVRYSNTSGGKLIYLYLTGYGSN